jgi:hypothetical protein
MNSSAPSQLLNTFACGDGTGSKNQFAVSQEFGQVACQYSSTLRIVEDVATPEEENNTGTGTGGSCADTNVICSDFCEIAGNEFLLRCRAEANGGSLSFGNSTTFNPIGGTNDQLVSALGLSNSDIKTNGVGYLLLAVALLLFNSLWIFTVFVMKGRGVVVDNPIYISALISVAIISAFVLMQFTDPLILIVAVVALVALASPKIVSLVSGIRGGGNVE